MAALWLSVRDAIMRRGLFITVCLRFMWNGGQVPKYRYFSDEEAKGLDLELMAMLDWSRARAGVPFTITCGMRTPEENIHVDGVQDSSHLRGLAVDLRVVSSEDRFRMVQALLLSGFKRIGIYSAHLHVDRDESLPQYVCWIGISH